MYSGLPKGFGDLPPDLSGRREKGVSGQRAGEDPSREENERKRKGEPREQGRSRPARSGLLNLQLSTQVCPSNLAEAAADQGILSIDEVFMEDETDLKLSNHNILNTSHTTGQTPLGD